MEAMALVEIYDLTWDNDYPDRWRNQLQLTCYPLGEPSLVVPRLSFAQIGGALNQLMGSVKTQIHHRDSWFWQSRFVAGWLVTLSHQSDSLAIQLLPTQAQEAYPQAPEPSSLWRIFVCWDKDLAEDGYFYEIKSYLLVPDQNGDHLERLEPVDWQKADSDPVMNQPLDVVWFDWKDTEKLVGFLQEVTRTKPMCFQPVETGEDSYSLVFSERPVSQQEANAFYQRNIEMAKASESEG